MLLNESADQTALGYNGVPTWPSCVLSGVEGGSFHHGRVAAHISIISSSDAEANIDQSVIDLFSPAY